MPERDKRLPIPEWAERERHSDMAWIAENQHILWPAAQQAFAELDRGAITMIKCVAFCYIEIDPYLCNNLCERTEITGRKKV